MKFNEKEHGTPKKNKKECANLHA